MTARRWFILFAATGILAVVGPALSFGALSHDLLILGQDQRCVFRQERNGVTWPDSASACGLPIHKLGAEHPRAMIYDHALAGAIFAIDRLELSAMNANETPARWVLLRHAYYAAGAIGPLLAAFVFLLLHRRGRRDAPKPSASHSSTGGPTA